MIQQIRQVGHTFDLIMNFIASVDLEKPLKAPHIIPIPRELLPAFPNGFACEQAPYQLGVHNFPSNYRYHDPWLRIFVHYGNQKNLKHFH